MREGGDPISHPSCPSSPLALPGGGPGCLLWLSGAPGSGKSTTAQLVARLHGWVYYDIDCFGELRNPFIHPDTPNPTMATERQRPLVGEGRQEREEICSEGYRAWASFLKTGELSESDWSAVDRYMDALCEDIQRQRGRLGGHWAVAGCLTLRRMRDRVRSNLGAQVSIVHLAMDQEDIRARLTLRHQDSAEILMVSSQLYKIYQIVIIFVITERGRTVSGGGGGGWSDHCPSYQQDDAATSNGGHPPENTQTMIELRGGGEIIFVLNLPTLSQ